MFLPAFVCLKCFLKEKKWKHSHVMHHRTVWECFGYAKSNKVKFSHANAAIIAISYVFFSSVSIK